MRNQKNVHLTLKWLTYSRVSKDSFENKEGPESTHEPQLKKFMSKTDWELFLNDNKVLGTLLDRAKFITRSSTYQHWDLVQDVVLDLFSKKTEMVPLARKEAIAYFTTTMKNTFLRYISKEKNRKALLEKNLPKESVWEYNRPEDCWQIFDTVNILIQDKTIRFSKMQLQIWNYMLKQAPVSIMAQELKISTKNIYTQRDRMMSKIAEYHSKRDIRSI